MVARIFLFCKKNRLQIVYKKIYPFILKASLRTVNPLSYAVHWFESSPYHHLIINDLGKFLSRFFVLFTKFSMFLSKPSTRKCVISFRQSQSLSSVKVVLNKGVQYVKYKCILLKTVRLFRRELPCCHLILNILCRPFAMLDRLLYYFY